MRKKFKSDLDKKAYVQIDFTFAVFIFFIFFFAILGMYTNYLNALNDQIQILELQADAKDICVLLTSSTGIPQDWSENLETAELMGFKSQNNLTLNGSHFTSLGQNNYTLIRDLLYPSSKSHFFLELRGFDSNTIYFSLGSLGGPESLNAQYSCHSYHNGEIVKLLVEVWR